MSVSWRLCCCLGVWMCLLYNVPLTEGQLSGIGSAQAIVAVAGDDVILPCHLVPALSAVDMTIEWSRPDLTPRHVHVHQDGCSSSDGQNPSYQYRTTLFTGELMNGNVSLKLSRVRRSDEGSYRCFLPSLGSQMKETQVQLIVGAVAEPKLSIVDLDREKAVLQCESGGWYPEPEVEWLDSEGHVLSAGPTERLKDPDGTFTVRQRVTVEKTATNRFTCRVQQRHINQTRETEIHVADHFFTHAQPAHCAGTIGFGVVVFLLVLGVTVALIFIVWRRKKAQNERKLNEQQSRLLTEKEKNTGNADEERRQDGAAGKLSEPHREEQKRQRDQIVQEAVKQQKQMWNTEQTKKDLGIVKKGLEGIRREQTQTEDAILEMVQQLQKGRFSFDTQHVDALKERLPVKMTVLKNETDKLLPHISTIEGLLTLIGSDTDVLPS